MKLKEERKKLIQMQRLSPLIEQFLPTNVRRAWLRTGLAFLAGGLGVERFMLNTIPLWSIHSIATVFILFSAGSFLLAAWRYQHLRVKLTGVDVDMVPLFLIRIIGCTLAVSALIALTVFARLI